MLVSLPWPTHRGQSNRGCVDRLAGVPQSVGELIDLLELEEIETGLFRARQPDTQLQRVFGGQVLAQAVMAASRTVVVTRVLHSLHGYFLIPGRTDTPIVYDVEAVRDGGSFEERMGNVACWNSVMDEDRYMVRRWNEFIAA